ncbi:hypothetical protein SMICM17S_12194 [Streptomyces microflavus]
MLPGGGDERRSLGLARLDGRWGAPIAEGALRDVLAGAWPVVVRVAAVASALYLVWRARRRTG